MKIATNALFKSFLLVLIAFTAALTLQAQTPVWQVVPPSGNWFGTNGSSPDLLRGMSYNPATNNVLVATRQGGSRIIVLDAANGDSVGVLNMDGVAGGVFALNKVEATSTGAIYAANLTVSGSNYKIYRWANQSASPENIFTSVDTDSIGIRLGDAFGVIEGEGNAVTIFAGGGAGQTEIAKFSYDGTNTTFDGKFTVDASGGRGGYSAGIGDEVWISGTNGGLEAIKMSDGASIVKVATEVVDLSVMNNRFLTIGGKEYVVAGAAFSGDNQNSYFIADVTDRDNITQVTTFEPARPDGATNGNNASSIAFDSQRGILFVMTTNFSIVAYNIADFIPSEELSSDPVWQIVPPTGDWFGTNGSNPDRVRGMSYNPATNHVLVATRQGGNRIIVLDAANGDSVGVLNMEGVAGGTFVLNKVEATSSGAIYAANLTVDGNNYKIYRWADETSAPENIFTSVGTDNIGIRLGDSFGVVQGEGNAATIFAGGGSSQTEIAKFSYDGTTATYDGKFTVAVAGGRGGFSAGNGNEVWISGTNAGLEAIKMTDGASIVKVATEVVDLSVMNNRYLTYSGKEYVVAGAAFSGDKQNSYYIADVTNRDNITQVTTFEPARPDGATNGNNASAIAYDSQRGILFVMTTNFSIVAYQFGGLIQTDTSIDEIAEEIPSSILLKQNYPNPFNPSTTLSFELPNASNVQLQVFNMMGQRVATLIQNQSFTAGTHQVRFDASNLPSGVYLYRLQAGTTSAVRKMTLIK